MAGKTLKTEGEEWNGFALLCSVSVFNRQCRLSFSVLGTIDAAIRNADKRLFDEIGETIGEAIRVVVDFLLGIFTNFFAAFGDFIDGLTRSLGINDSFFSIAVLVIGLLILWGGLRAFLRGSLLGGIVRTVLGLFILSWLMM
ncbi:hypothetical protein HORIV_63450 [Vreelandella olivaria]|uniref:MFS transporter n=1 Tax=Vreelandella olivaria TaxID=390919 RepID=A0ABM7GSW1_9GAMM|nr:hypothetical protein HORIV_63450 [Halomonas olivaria]